MNDFEDIELLFGGAVEVEFISQVGRPYMLFRVFNRWVLSIEFFHCQIAFIVFNIPVKVRYCGLYRRNSSGHKIGMAGLSKSSSQK